MAGEVTSLTITEQTLFNLTITEDDGTVLTLSLTDPVTIVNTSMAEIDATMVNNGSGKGVYKQKDLAQFVMRSISDDDKTIEADYANSSNEIKIKLPDAGISTPDDFIIKADSDATANIKMVGGTVDLSKAKLITDLDANSQDLDSVGTITANTGTFTTVNTEDINVSDDLTVTDRIIMTRLQVSGAGGTAMLSSGIDAKTSVADLTATTADINAGTIDNSVIGGSTAVAGTFTTATATTGNITTVNADDVIVSDDLTVGDLATIENLVVDSTSTLTGTTTTGVLTSTNFNATTADINAGTIDNTTIGVTTPAVGTFTTATATTGAITTVNSTTGNITTVNSTNVNSTNLDVDTGTIDNLTSTTVDINGGAIDGTVVGGSTPAAVSTSSLVATTADINAGTIDNTTIGASTPSTIVTTNLTATTADINAGTIDNSVIGGSTAVAGTFTTATATTGAIATVNATDVNATGTGTIGTLNVTGNTTLTGNLTVNGTQTVVNTETLTVDDNIIVLNNNVTGTPSENGGIEIERGTSDNAVFQWNESTDVFEFKEGSAYSDIKADKAEFTDTVAIGGVTPESVGANDLVVADSILVGGNMRVDGTSHFSVLGFTNQVKIDAETPGTPENGHGLLIWDSDNTDNWIGGYPYNSSGNSPYMYMNSTSITLDSDAGAGVNPKTTIAQGNITLESAGLGHSTTLTGSNSTFGGTVTLGGLDDYFGTSVTASWDSTDTEYNGSWLGTSSKPFARLYVKELYDTEMHGHLVPVTTNTYDLGSASKTFRSVYVGAGSLYIDGFKVLGSDSSGEINITTDTAQDLWIAAGGASGTDGQIYLTSRENVTELRDTTVHLGDVQGSNNGQVNVRGVLDVATRIEIGDFDITEGLINNTATNQPIELRTNGTGYIHLNHGSQGCKIGATDGAISLTADSSNATITVSNTNGALTLAGNGTGKVNVNSNSVISGTQPSSAHSGVDLTNPILELVTDGSGWDRPQMMLKDSNGDVVSVVGQHNTGPDVYQYNFTLDPNNTHGRTGVTTYAGDYFVAFNKNYSDQSEIHMAMDVYGAHDGFNITARDDFNSGGGNQYELKTIRLKGDQVELYANSVEVLKVQEDRVTLNKLTKLHNAGSDPSSPEEGDVYYNTGTDRIKLYTGAGWKTLSVD